MKHVAPSLHLTSFNCPHCDALAKQFWKKVLVKPLDSDDHKPVIFVDPSRFKEFQTDNQEELEEFVSFCTKINSGIPFVSDALVQDAKTLCNVHVSQCYNCQEMVIWIGQGIVFPCAADGPLPNFDLPPTILADYREASSILDRSPRGAAALIRLCIQKLCKYLGKSGENIDADIAALVKEGLDVRVQMALDAVRVIGNNAVHPGEMDFRDDRATAESLFRLLNLIVEKTISQPKHVDEVYAMLPVGVVAAIAKRDDRYR